MVLKLSNNKNFYVLKIYSRKDNFNLEKRKREEYFLKYMRKRNIHNVPLLIKSNIKKMYILISYLEGENIISIDRKFTKKYFNFIKEINLIKNLKDNYIIKAAESCTNPEQLIKLIDIRMEDIKYGNHIKDKNVNKLIFNYIYPEWVFLRKNIEVMEKYLSLDFKEEIISLSDVGIHNCLKRNKEILFFDFEHSGKDDIAKLAIDFTLQPDAINLPKYTYEMFSILYEIDKSNINWLKRYKTYIPVYRIKWCLIMLKRLKINFEYNSKDELDIYLRKIYEYFEKSRNLVNSSLDICIDFIDSKKEDAEVSF